MDNVGIVVESLDESIAFFEEIGSKLKGQATFDKNTMHHIGT